MNIEAMIKSYNDQTLAAFSNNGNNGNMLYKSEGLGSGVSPANMVHLPYATGGIFADCALEQPVLNLLIQPIYSLANIIPVVPDNNDKTKWAFLSDLTPATGSYPTTPCDDSPVVGDIAAAYAEFYPGRVSYKTKTMELDQLIRRAHQGIAEDLYFVGSTRGVSALNTISPSQASDRDFVARGAIRRALANLMRQMQIDLLHQLWSGDPTDAAVNTVGGGRKEFWGLNALIANDYGSKTFVTGTNKTLLNSYVLDFEDEKIGGGEGIYAFLQQLEDTLYQRAAMMGLLPTQWAWVMHPITWSELIKWLPCEMLTDSCGVPAPGNSLTGAGVSINVSGDNGMGIQALRQQLMNNMALTVNGRTHTVILDSGVPIVQGDDGEDPPAAIAEYTSSIYLIPLNVAGENVLEWRHRNYRSFEEILAPIPQSADVGLRGWTDGGRYHLIVERRKRCFEIDVKIEPSLVFRAPHLAGRIDNIVAAPKGFRPNFNFAAQLPHNQ